MGGGEDRREPGRARRHARPPSPQDAAPQNGAENGWPSRYGPPPGLRVAPDSLEPVPGGEPPPRPRRPPRPPPPAGGSQPGPGVQPGPASQPPAGWGADPYQG